MNLGVYLLGFLGNGVGVGFLINILLEWMYVYKLFDGEIRIKNLQGNSCATRL